MSVGVILLLHAFTLSIHTARGRKSSILSAGSTGGQEDQPIAGGQVKRFILRYDLYRMPGKKIRFILRYDFFLQMTMISM